MNTNTGAKKDTGAVVVSSLAREARRGPGHDHHAAPICRRSARPRVDRAKRHDRLDIITIARYAALCGADSWVEVEQFGTSKVAGPRTCLALLHGIPSHDTFDRVFAALDPQQVEQRFLGGVQAAVGDRDGGTIAVNGKTLRRAQDRANGREPLHLVSAWATEQGLVLGQVATDPHSNEITAIPALLETLLLHDRVVRIDAMGCETAIAAQIQAGGGDYVLALKENQPPLHERVAHHFAVVAGDAGGLTQATPTTVGKDPGRIERRWCGACGDLAGLDPEQTWPGLRSVAAVTGERRIGTVVPRETRYDLSSLPADAARIGAAVRGHWGIENQLHWVLDLAFREDAYRVRSGHAAENFAVLRHIALNLRRRETTTTIGITAKRLKGGWDDTYLRTVLAG